jgi:hypothetical protein
VTTRREGRPVLAAGDGLPITTACPTPCDDDCELGTAGCHERHAYRPSHDPEECEKRRAALDEHSRLSAELDTGADDADLDDGWVCPPCKRGRCDRCTDRDCCCCAGAPDDPA